ncbi:MAG: cation:proton antiporter [Nitrospinae bacterium]|nr:cation:proton antiporter [Nitrospinota bacterium]
MPEIEFLRDLILIFAWSALVVFAFDKLKIPAIVGFLVSGVALGPHGLSMVRDIGAVELLAEIGVVLLLFTVGLEFSLTKIYEMRSKVLIGGAVQVALTIAITALAAWGVTGDGNKAVFIGFLVALSSTAVVLKGLMDKAEINTMQGQLIIGVLIFQDLCAVPMMLFIPFLAGQGGAETGLVALGLKAALLIVLVLAATRWVVPTVLRHVVDTRNRELFIMVVMLMCLGTAYLTFEAGLSLALGAFLAGMMISDSEYSHQVVAEILPFRDILNSLFFVSIGMLLDLRYAFDHLPSVLAVTIGIILIKAPIAALPALMFRYPLRLAIISGLSLSQIGEFSFVLARFGQKSGMDLGGLYQSFLAAAIITMAATPFLMGGAPRFASMALKGIPRRREDRTTGSGVMYGPIRDHVVVVGYGLNGQHLSKVLKATGIPYNILDMNPSVVREYVKRGEPIHYGDGSREHVLDHVSIRKARLLVVATSDPAMERRIVSVARRMSPKLHIIVRTRYVREIEPLSALGANEVIPEEFETSIEIFSHVLQVYSVPYNVIMEEINNIRSAEYRVLRHMPTGRMESPLASLIGHKLGMQTVEVPEGGVAHGKTIAGLNLRAKTGASVLAVQRHSDLTANPAPEHEVRAKDILYIVGDAAQLKSAADLIRTKQEQ